MRRTYSQIDMDERRRIARWLASGRPFRTPFARMSSSRLDSPAINVVWGWLNFLIAFLLFANIRPLYIGTLGDTIFLAASVLVTGVLLARIFAGDAN